MTLPKLKIDNSVKYIGRANNLQSEDSPKDPKPKTASLPRKQSEKTSKNFKKIHGKRKWRI